MSVFDGCLLAPVLIWLMYACLEWHRTKVDPLIQLIRLLVLVHCAIVVVLRTLRNAFATVPADIERRRVWLMRAEGVEL